MKTLPLSHSVFPIRLPGGTRTVRQMSEVRAVASEAMIADVVIPFNGVLLTRSLVEQIGLPRAEFFIWGDDVEYLWRADARPAPAQPPSWTPTIRHPSVGDLGSPMMFGRNDLQPQPQRPEALLHVTQQPRQSAALPRRPHVLAFVGQDDLVLHCSPSPRRRRRAQRESDVRRVPRDSRDTGGTSRERRAETVAVVVVTYDGAGLLPDASPDWPPWTGPRTRSRRRQRQHRPHLRPCSTGSLTCRFKCSRSEENLGGAAASTAALSPPMSRDSTGYG